MSKILEIHDQIAANYHFKSTYSPYGAQSWRGPFYAVAANTAKVVVPNEMKQPPLQLALRSLITSASQGLKLEVAPEVNAVYLPVENTLLTEADIATAIRLFFHEGAPAQPWFILALGLIKPKHLGITVADARSAVMTDLHLYGKTS